MINVLQRLAELDAKNPNVIKEEDNSYTGYGDPRFTKITPEYEGEGPGEVEVTIADPVASDYDNNNEVMVPVTVSYVNGLDKHGRSENTIKKVINKNTGQEIPINDISEYDLYDIIHPALDQDVKDTQDHRRDDSYEESSLREGQNKMTKNVNECGMMGSMSQPRSPASINMTADSGAELTGMLRDIMQLAGLKQVGPADLGHEHEPAVVSAEPTVSVAKIDDEPTVMRSMLDKLNPGMKPDDEQKVDEWDYEPANATDVPPMNQDAMLNTGMHNQDPAGHPGAAKGRHLKNHPVASPEATYESLMSEYRKFLGEADNYNDAAARTANLRAATATTPDKKAAWDDEAAFLKTAANTKSNADAALRSLAQSGDFDEIYQALGRDDEVGRALQDMSNDISIEYGYHPDDDIEQIIDTIADQLEKKYGSEKGMAEGPHGGDDYTLGNPVDKEYVYQVWRTANDVRDYKNMGKWVHDGGTTHSLADAKRRKDALINRTHGVKAKIVRVPRSQFKLAGPQGHLPEEMGRRGVPEDQKLWTDGTVEYSMTDPNNPDAEIDVTIDYTIDHRHNECRVDSVTNSETGEDLTNKVDRRQFIDVCVNDYERKRRGDDRYGESVSEADTMESMLVLAGLKK